MAGVEPLAVALGISTRAAYSHIRRLERVGLVWRVPIGDGGGGAIAISRLGAARVRDDGLPAVVPRSQVPATGAHSRAVSWVAAHFELKAYRWLGPAELRSNQGWRLQRADDAGHLPDLGVSRARGHRHAIEVELNSKSNDRLRMILRAYHRKLAARELSSIAYITTRPLVARAVQRHADDLGLSTHMQVIPLDRVVRSLSSPVRHLRSVFSERPPGSAWAC